jgi:predicted transcriptional regulator YdeE
MDIYKMIQKQKIIFLACLTALCANLAAVDTLTKGRHHMTDYVQVEQQEMQIIGIACRTSNAQDAAPVDIPKLWERFVVENIAGTIPNKTSNAVVALYCDYEGDHTQPYTLVIGCPVSSDETIPEGMLVKTIPAGAYARFSAQGEQPQSVIETWGKIWQAPLKRTYTGDYEFYSEEFFNDFSQPVDIFIAL